jgi:membrane-associated phospholipid phosphatase
MNLSILKKYLWVLYGIVAIVLILGISLLYDPIAAIQEAQISAGLRTAITLATPLDLLIPLVPATIIIYWYVFYGFLFFSYFYFAFIQREFRNALVIAFALVNFVAFAIYLAFTVQGPERVVTVTDIFSYQIARLYQGDTHYNCLPSLHGSTSLLTAYAIWKTKKQWGYIAWPTAIAIQVSTLFVRQHWIVDQIAAALITIPIAYFVFDWLKYTKVPSEVRETPWWKIIVSIGVAVCFMILYIWAFYIL